MNKQNFNPDEVWLGALLCEARATPVALRISYELTRHDAVSAVTPDPGVRDDR